MTTYELDPRWLIMGHLNGGYLAGVCALAASDVLDGAPPLTISTHYLTSVTAGGSAELDVDVVRRSRLSTARVSMSVDGVLMLESLVTVGVPREDPRALADAPPPELPAWDDCLDTGVGEYAERPGNELLRYVELRLHPSHAPAMLGGPALDRAVVHGRIAYRDGAPADMLLAAAAWDLLPPAPWFVHIADALPTVAAQVVLFPGGIVGPLVLEARCDTIHDGLADETARVWDATGRLVAASRQTALLLGR